MKLVLLGMLFMVSGLSLSANNELTHADLYLKNIEVLKGKIDSGSSLTKSLSDKYYESPLNVAIYEDNLEAVKLLLESNGHSYLEKNSYGNSKVIPSSSTTDLFNTVSGRTKNPEAYYQLLLEYVDIKHEVDEILYYIIGSSDKSLPVVKALLEQGADPTKIFTISEIGEQSNGLNLSWSYAKSGRLEMIYAYLLKYMMNKENITEKQVFEKYIKPINDRRNSNQECC